MKHLCPLGHRVIIVQHGEHKRKGHCEECENIYPRPFLIPVVEGIRKDQHKLYMIAFREGYKAAVMLQLSREDAIIDLSSSAESA